MDEARKVCNFLIAEIPQRSFDLTKSMPPNPEQPLRRAIPARGPLRRIVTYRDAFEAIEQDLPAPLRRSQRWVRTTALLFTALDTGTPGDCEAFENQLKAILKIEGW